MNTYLKFGLAAAAVVAAVIIGLQFIGQPNIIGPPDATPTASVAEPSASVGPQALPGELGRPIGAGTYSLPDFPVGITFEIPTVDSPAGWRACSESAVEQAVCYWPTADTGVGQLAFLIVTNVATDPCSPGEVYPDPPVGPSVDDLVTAISNLEGYEATAPVPTTVDGYDGQQLTVTAPTDSGCEGFAPWATEDRHTGMGPGESNILHVIDVDGVRVMISIATDQASPHAAAFDQVLESVQIEP
jgi:hypothetical protein